MKSKGSIEKRIECVTKEKKRQVKFLEIKKETCGGNPSFRSGILIEGLEHAIKVLDAELDSLKWVLED